MTHLDPNVKYIIKSVHDENNVLSYTNEEGNHPKLIVEASNQHDAQQWWIRDGYIINAHNNLCITVGHDQTALVLVGAAGANDQRWIIDEEGTIGSVAHQGKVLDIDGKTGPTVLLYAKGENYDWQQFRAEQAPYYGQQQQPQQQQQAYYEQPQQAYYQPQPQQPQQQPYYQPGQSYEMGSPAQSPPAFPSTQNQANYQNTTTFEKVAVQEPIVTAGSDQESEVEFKKAHEGFSCTRFIKQCFETFKFFFSPILAIIFTIMSLISFITIVGLFSQFQTILNDFNKQPIIDFTLSTTSSCPSGFENVENMGVWGGIKSACDCRSISVSNSNKYNVDRELTYTDNLCPKTNQTKAGCVGVSGIDKVDIHLWHFTNGANQKFCQKRGGNSLFQQVQMNSNLECPSGYQLCSGTSNSITEHTRCAKDCGLAKFELKDGAGGAELSVNGSANNWPIVGFRMSEGAACWDINKDGSTDSSSVTSYRDGSAVGNGGSGCEGNDINPYFEKKLETKLEDLLLANGLNVDTHPRSTVIRESVKTTTTWTFYAERQRPWTCSPQVVKNDKTKRVIKPSEFQGNADAIKIIFGVQVTLFVISILTTLAISIAIPALLIYNGILRKIWCGFATLKEKDRDDIERYQLFTLIFSFVVKSIKIIPLIVCIIVSYFYQSFYQRLQEAKCSDDIFQEVIDSYTKKMNDSTGWMNFLMLGVAVLSCFGSILSCGFCWFKIIRNKCRGRDAFDRGVRFKNDGKDV